MGKHKFHKILIANRGEIALRILRAVHSLGKSAVTLHSFADRELPFVLEADESYSLGSGGLSESYLDQAKIIKLAKEAGADAIHPGYGFLAENAEFARRCQEEGITFIGPDPEHIRIMGDKSRAREKAIELGLPVLKAYTGELAELLAGAADYPYPVLIKPTAGGGGKGMRIVRRQAEFPEAAREAAREAENYFGSGGLYVEKYLPGPRHIEVQVMADKQGNALHLFERECSVQRRYQKIIEEAPSASISPGTRQMITENALKLVKGIGYYNAGTVEFLMDADSSFYFLEMNTRIQVEHPVSEMITGIDLVKEQIRVAEGASLSFGQEDIDIRGHAIEARIYAEDPLQDFLPSTGTIGRFLFPKGQQIRMDAGYREGNRVESFYDPMIAKLIARGENREEAINLLTDSLKKLHLTGITTNRDYLVSLLKNPLFAENRIHTTFLEQEGESILEIFQKNRQQISHEILLSSACLIALQPLDGKSQKDSSPWKAIGHWRLVPELNFEYQNEKIPVRYELLAGRKKIRVRIKGKAHTLILDSREQENFRIRINEQQLHCRATVDQSEIHIDVDGHLYTIRRRDVADDRYIQKSGREHKQNSNQVVAPLNGRIIEIMHAEGEKVETGQSMILIESMKMENKILAPHGATIKKIHVSVGEQVHNTQLLFTLDTNDRSTDQKKASATERAG